MDANSDGKLIKDEYVAAHTKNAPADKQEKAKERAGRMWDRLAGDKKELTEDEYKAAMEKMMKEWKEKGGKKRGEKKE
jgi:predicted trehalose synthase